MLTCLGDIRFHTNKSGSEDHAISIGRFHNGTVWDYGFHFAEAMRGETHRGLGLLAATTLDVMLEKLIYVSLRSGSEKELFGPSGLFDTLSSKISYCKFHQLISGHSANNLHLVRKIRNDFAHKFDGSFSEPSIASRVKCLNFADLKKIKNTPNLPFRFKAHSVSLMLYLAAMTHYKQMSAERGRRIYENSSLSILEEHRRIYFEHVSSQS